MIKYSHVIYDWKQGGCEEEYEEALAEFGLVMTPDPVQEDSDTFGFFITEGEPTKEQVQEMMIDCYGEELIEELEL